LAACEDAAHTAGFRSLALMATLPGEPFYRAAGYIADPVSIVEVGDVAIPFVLMHKIGGEACDQ
jgi:hypothetical protein